MSASAEKIRFSRRTVVKGGALIVGFALTGRPTSVSAQGLAGAPRRVWTRRALLTQVWGTEWPMDEHLVEVHIGNLRKKLGDKGREPRFIRTVRGVGYRMAPVERLSEPVTVAGIQEHAAALG